MRNDLEITANATTASRRYSHTFQLPTDLIGTLMREYAFSHATATTLATIANKSEQFDINLIFSCNLTDQEQLQALTHAMLNALVKTNTEPKLQEIFLTIPCDLTFEYGLPNITEEEKKATVREYLKVIINTIIPNGYSDTLLNQLLSSKASASMQATYAEHTINFHIISLQPLLDQAENSRIATQVATFRSNLSYSVSTPVQDFLQNAPKTLINPLAAFLQSSAYGTLLSNDAWGKVSFAIIVETLTVMARKKNISNNNTTYTLNNIGMAGSTTLGACYGAILKKIGNTEADPATMLVEDFVQGIGYCLKELSAYMPILGDQKALSAYFNNNKASTEKKTAAIYCTGKARKSSPLQVAYDELPQKTGSILEPCFKYPCGQPSNENTANNNNPSTSTQPITTATQTQHNHFVSTAPSTMNNNNASISPATLATAGSLVGGALQGGFWLTIQQTAPDQQAAAIAALFSGAALATMALKNTLPTAAPTIPVNIPGRESNNSSNSNSPNADFPSTLTESLLPFYSLSQVALGTTDNKNLTPSDSSQSPTEGMNKK